MNMKPRVLGALSAAILIFASPALAWDVPGTGLATAQVGSVETWGNGSIHFTLVGSPALCSTGVPNQSWGLIDVGTAGLTVDGVKNMLSVLLAAKLSGKPVTVAGWNTPSGACNIGVVISPAP